MILACLTTTVHPPISCTNHISTDFTGNTENNIPKPLYDLEDPY